MSTPYQGQPVVYTLSQGDVDFLTQRRSDTGTAGNTLSVGDACPAVIVKLWNPTLANLTVFLDGPDTFWATSRPLGADGQESSWFIPADDDTAAPAAAPEGQ
jgi:hypothetical protein